MIKLTLYLLYVTQSKNFLLKQDTSARVLILRSKLNLLSILCEWLKLTREVCCLLNSQFYAQNAWHSLSARQQTVQLIYLTKGRFNTKLEGNLTFETKSSNNLLCCKLYICFYWFMCIINYFSGAWNFSNNAKW